MSLNRLWLFLAVALPVLAAVIAPLSTVDLTYQLRAGAEIIAARALPTVDTWTFTAAGSSWVDQQWGAQVLLSLVEDVGSWTGLVLLRAVLTGIVFAALLLVARRRGLDTRTAALLVIAAFVVAAPAMGLRPQLFGMAFFALVLLLVSMRREQPRALWFVPIVTVLWANLHGSFILAPAVLGLAWLEDVHDHAMPRDPALVVALVSAAAACLTPLGPAVWAYAVGLSMNPEVTARITEWQPTSIRTVAGLLYFGSVALVVLLIARRGRVVPWPTLLWLAVFAVIALYAERGVAWWPLAAVPAVASLVPVAVARTRAEAPLLRRLNGAVAAVLALGMVIFLPLWQPVDPRTGAPEGLLTDAPPGLTQAVREVARPGAHVFQPQPWGSWFEYAVPDVLVAIDSRIELFPPEVWDQYEGVVAGVEGWDEQLATWGVEFVVVDEDHTDFRGRLEGAGWEVVTEDEDGAVLQAPVGSGS